MSKAFPESEGYIYWPDKVCDLCGFPHHPWTCVGPRGPRQEPRCECGSRKVPPPLRAGRLDLAARCTQMIADAYAEGYENGRVDGAEAAEADALDAE